MSQTASQRPTAHAAPSQEPGRIGMAGLATRLAASVAEARGYTSAAGYLQSMGSMAVSGESPRAAASSAKRSGGREARQGRVVAGLEWVTGGPPGMGRIAKRDATNQQALSSGRGPAAVATTRFELVTKGL